MPNWCCNKLAISGPKPALDAFRATLVDGKFALSQTLPTPEELTGIIDGGTRINGELYRHWRERNLAGMSDQEKEALILSSGGEVQGNRLLIPVTGALEKELLEKYGALSWYDWNVKNLGTKWDADGEVTDTGEELLVWFDTAWAPPSQWVYTVSAKFPELTFDLYFSEGGMGYYGSLRVQDGTVQDETQGEDMFVQDVDWDAADDSDDPDSFGQTEEYTAFRDEHNLQRGG